MSIKNLLARTAKITNNVLGELGTYTRKDGETIENVNVILDESAEIQTDFGAIGGYDTELILLKDEISFINRLDVVEVEGERYRINLVKKETTTKFYCSVVKL